MLDRSKQPEIHDIEFPTLPPMEMRRLANGVELYVLRGGTQDIVEIDIITRSGTLYSELPGVARPVGSMLGEGAGEYTSKQIADRFDHYAVMVSGSTGLVTSELSVTGLTKYMSECMDIVEAMVKNPTMPQQELDIFKEREIHKHLTRSKKTKYRAYNQMRHLLYTPDSRYSRTLNREDFDKMTREALLDFHSRAYVSGGTKIFVAGQPDDALLQRVEDMFGNNWEKRDCLEAELYPKYNDKVEMVFDEVEDAKQNSIVLSCKSLTSDSDDCFLLEMLNTIYGGYFGSRLMTNIREKKGLTYGINSGYSYNRFAGTHTIASDVKSDMCEAVLDEIWKEMEILRTEPVGEDELNLVKSYIKGGILHSVDNIIATNDVYKSSILNETGMEYYIKQYEAMTNATPEDLLRVAQEYYKIENYHVVISGIR